MSDDEYAELFKKLSSGQSTGSSWQDIADELSALGRTVSEVLRRAFEGTDTASGMSTLRSTVADALADLNRAVDGTPEAAQARDQLVDIRDQLRAAAERASSDLRPELLKMLRQANSELRRRSGLDADQ
jgi:ElaB/YqjD/DUF883 family membrane-anchored ribosome-binding protein